MQCTSFYRDPYETAAWQMYLRESALRVAREEVAFLEATGGATNEELALIRGRVIAGPVIEVKEEEDCPAMPSSSSFVSNNNNAVTVSLKSVLTEVVHSDAANQLCRRVRPLLDQLGIVTFKKHQAIHILRTDAQRVKELGAGLV